MAVNKKLTKVLSVRIRHHINAIIIPSNLSNKGYVFHKREGLPIKVSVESFLIITIQCEHKINHIFLFPIESLIEWRIINGVKDGAFKHGYGLTAKYSDTDNENCVIYYPIIRGSKDDYKDKEIPILIRIHSNRIKGSIENFVKKYCYENNTIPLTEDNTTHLLILHLKQKQGFLNKMFYESSITDTQTSQKELEYSSRQLVTTNKHDENSNYTYSFDENRKAFSMESEYNSRCAECKLNVTFQSSSSIYFITNQNKITIDTNRLLSSEYIKISNSISEYVYKTEDKPDIDFELKNNNKSIGKFRINNCPLIKTRETYWTCTAGAFPCGGSNSNSVIYYSPNEKELSKSPITLNLYERYLYRPKDNEYLHLIDQKKIWIVRKAIMGG